MLDSIGPALADANDATIKVVCALKQFRADVKRIGVELVACPKHENPVCAEGRKLTGGFAGPQQEYAHMSGMPMG